jgi:hypothetical protein
MSRKDHIKARLHGHITQTRTQAGFGSRHDKGITRSQALALTRKEINMKNPNLSTRMTTALSLAHLASIARADDDERKQRPGESRPDYRERMRKLDKKDDGDAGDDDEDLPGKRAIVAARLREQARCTAIMGCRAAGRNVPLAANLAFLSRLSRDEAIAVLQQGTAGGVATDPPPGSDAKAASAAASWARAFDRAAGHVAPTAPTAIDRGWDRAFQRAGAVRRK